MVPNTPALGFFFSHRFPFLIKSHTADHFFWRKYCGIAYSFAALPRVNSCLQCRWWWWWYHRIHQGQSIGFYLRGSWKLYTITFRHTKNVFSEETISAFFYSLHLAVVAINKLMTTIIDFSCNSSWSSTKLRVVAVMMMAICKKLCFWFSSLRLAEAESDRWHCATQLWIR